MINPILMTNESLKGYGQLVSSTVLSNSMVEQEFSYIADTGSFFIQGNITTGILVGKKRPLALTKLERHMKTPELLISLENDALIALAKPTEQDRPEADSLQLFYVKQGDSFVLNQGTWHWVPFPAETNECKFLVVFRENTGIEDGGVIDYIHRFD